MINHVSYSHTTNNLVLGRWLAWAPMKKCINSLAFLLVEDVVRRLVVNNKLTSNNIGTGSQVDEYPMRTSNQLTWEKDVSFWYRFLFSNKHELNKGYDLSSNDFCQNISYSNFFVFSRPLFSISSIDSTPLTTVLYICPISLPFFPPRKRFSTNYTIFWR